MSKDTQFDVAVIGIGAMGSASLYTLAKRGLKVCGIEQFGIAHTKGSSHGETRLIRKAYFEHPDYVSLLNRAYTGWKELEEESGQQLLNQNGLILAGKPGCTTIKGLEACYAQHDLPHEIIDVSEAQKRWPVINFPEGSTVYYDPIAGFIHAEKSIREFSRQAIRHGATLYSRERVNNWQVVDNNTVQINTDKRTITADRLIIVSGAWSSDLLHSLELNLEVQRKLLFWYGASDLRYFQTDTFPNFFIETEAGGFYGFPSINSSGVKIGEHYQKGETSHPDRLNRYITEKEDQPVSQFVSHTFPGLIASPTKSTVCMYTMSPDGHFIVDHHPRHQNVVVATGFSGHGFKFAPTVGEILADLSTKGNTELPMDFLRLSRFK